MCGREFLQRLDSVCGRGDGQAEAARDRGHPDGEVLVILGDENADRLRDRSGGRSLRRRSGVVTWQLTTFTFEAMLSGGRDAGDRNVLRQPPEHRRPALVSRLVMIELRRKRRNDLYELHHAAIFVGEDVAMENVLPREIDKAAALFEV